MAAAWLVLALVALVSSCLVVASRRLAHGALWLVVSFLAVAGIFLLQGAEFLAAVQVIVYAGSVVVLFVFVAMTVGFGQRAGGWPTASWLALGAGIGALVLAELGAALLSLAGASGPGAPEAGSRAVNAKLGTLLFSSWIVPLEAFSLLVLAVMVGIAALRREGRGRP